MVGWDMWEQLVTSSFLSPVINVLLFSLHGCLFEDKNGLSGLLIIFWPVISNIVLVYLKLFSCAHANKWDITNRHSHVKGEDAEICCWAVQT